MMYMTVAKDKMIETPRIIVSNADTADPKVSKLSYSTKSLSNLTLLKLIPVAITKADHYDSSSFKGHFQSRHLAMLLERLLIL